MGFARCASGAGKRGVVSGDNRRPRVQIAILVRRRVAVQRAQRRGGANADVGRSAAVEFETTADRGKLQFQSRVVVTQRSEEHTSELQSLRHLVCRLLLEK